jgi:hypothetical protein
MSKKKSTEQMIPWRLFVSGTLPQDSPVQNECATHDAATLKKIRANYGKALERAVDTQEAMDIQEAKALERAYRWSAICTHNDADHISDGGVDFVAVVETGEHILVEAKVSGVQVMVADSSIRPEPPKVADFLLTVFACSSPKKDGIVGDINERFARECEEVGVSMARRRFWGRTFYIVWPLVRRALARTVKWGAVIEGVRRFF